MLMMRIEIDRVHLVGHVMPRSPSDTEERSNGIAVSRVSGGEAGGNVAIATPTDNAAVSIAHPHFTTQEGRFVIRQGCGRKPWDDGGDVMTVMAVVVWEREVCGSFVKHCVGGFLI